jgi:hypothetical protein
MFGILRIEPDLMLGDGPRFKFKVLTHLTITNLEPFVKNFRVNILCGFCKSYNIWWTDLVFSRKLISGMISHTAFLFEDRKMIILHLTSP